MSTSTRASCIPGCARPMNSVWTCSWSFRRPTPALVRPSAIACGERPPSSVAMHMVEDERPIGVYERPIGVFDSGLGGLTVMRALLDLLPSEDLVYFGDTGRFPYGPKPSEEVLKYSFEIADLLLERGVKMLVVACNSASAAALEQLQGRLDVPVIGVIVSGVRAAIRSSLTGRIGVIGTVGTISSGAYQRAASQISP